MKAIILAGGFGTRLRPSIGDNTPKCLAPVMGRPMITFTINNMKKYGITDITLALHYKAEAFMEKFGNMKYKIEDNPLGTGGAIKNCIEGTEPVLVVNGDTIAPVDYSDMLASHIPPLTIAVTQKNGHMQSAGVYIISPEIFDDFPQAAFSFEQDVIPYVLKKFYPIPFFTDYGTPEEYENAPKDWV